MSDILIYLTSKQFLESLLVVILAAILLILIKEYLIKKVSYKTNNRLQQKSITFKGILFSILQYTVVLVSIFLILSVNGVNVTGLLAGLGIVATIVGLALQDTFKDILSGINIYNNNFYKVNDIVLYNGDYYQVKYFNARVTKLKNVWTNSTYTVCNSNINSIEKVKDTFLTDIVFLFRDDHELIMKALDEFTIEAKKIDKMKNVINPGCFKIDTTGNHYIIVFNIDPLDYFERMCTISEILIKSLKKYDLEPVNVHHVMVEDINKKI